MVYLIDNHASSPYHNPRSQPPIWNNPTPSSYGSLDPQTFYAQSGDIRQMSAVQSAFMKEQMAYMMREMESEFGGDNEEQNTRHIIIPGDHIEVDDNIYQSDFDSHKKTNNIIENSFGEGGQEIGVWRMIICVS